MQKYKYVNTHWEEEAKLQEAQNSSSEQFNSESYTEYSESTQNLSESKFEAEGSDFGISNTSETGSLRYNEGKPEMSQLSEDFLLDLADLLTRSAKKYGKYNWRLGQNFSTTYDSCQRHLMKFMKGEDLDDESELNHLLHAAANLMIMYESYLYNPELDDRFKRKKDDN